MRYTTGWVKVRRQDPPTFELLSIEAQAFYFLLTRLLDDRGALALPGPAGLRGICRELNGVGSADWPRIKAYIDELCEEGSLIWDAAKGELLAPAHVEDQKCSTTEADRKRVYRSRVKELQGSLPDVPKDGTNSGTSRPFVHPVPAQVRSSGTRPDASLHSVPSNGTFEPRNGTSGLRSFTEESQDKDQGETSPRRSGALLRQAQETWVESDTEAITCAEAKRRLLLMVEASRDASGVARLLLLRDEPSANEVMSFQSAISHNPATEQQLQEMGRLLAAGEYPNRGRGAAVNALCARSSRGDAFAELLAKAKAPPGLRPVSGGLRAAPGRAAPSAPADGQPEVSPADLRGYLQK